MAWNPQNCVYALAPRPWGSGNAPANYNAGIMPSYPIGVYQPFTFNNMAAGFGFVNNGGDSYLRFDGNDDYMWVGGDVTELNSVNQFSIEFWLWENILHINEVIWFKSLDANNMVMLLSNIDGSMRFRLYNGGVSRVQFLQNTVIAANTWYHMMVIFNTGVLRIYVDGANVPLVTVGVIPAVTANLGGANVIYGNGINSLDGRIAWSALYSDADLTRPATNHALGRDMGLVGTNTVAVMSFGLVSIILVSPDSGPDSGGNTVIIIGTGFLALQQGGTLTIDGVELSSYNSWSDTVIVGIVPAGTVGAKDVVITNDNGVTATRAGGYTYTGYVNNDSLLGLIRTTDIFRKKPNWIKATDVDFNFLRELIQFPGTSLDIYDLGIDLESKLQYKFTNVNKEDEYYIQNFFIEHKGKLSRFWVPLYKNSFELDSTIQNGDTVITIRNVYFNLIDRGYERIFIEMKNGDLITRSCAAIVAGGDTENILLNEPMDRQIQQDDIRFFGRLFLSRFADDILDLAYHNNAVTECNIQFIELPKEYIVEVES